jgi:hypothetical protein
MSQRIPGRWQTPASNLFKPLAIGRWAPDPLARGPFDGIQGGAAAALMSAAIEVGDGWFIASATTHFLRPVPLAPLAVAAQPLRQGRRVCVVDATLSAPTGLVAVQRSTLIRMQDCAGLPTSPKSPASPDQFPLQSRPAPHGLSWLMDAMEARLGPDGVWWFQLRIPIVGSDEPMTWVLPAADWAHGLAAPAGAATRPPGIAIPNPDLTVHLFRRPVGAWIGVEPACAWSRAAIGAGWAALHDTDGLVGRVAMSIAVSPTKE